MYLILRMRHFIVQVSINISINLSKRFVNDAVACKILCSDFGYEFKNRVRAGDGLATSYISLERQTIPKLPILCSV